MGGLGVIGAIFPILTVLIGGVCILLFVSTKTLRDSRDDQEKRIDQLEAERLRDKAEIASQRTAVTFWRSAATGDQKLDDLQQLLTDHHADSVKHWVQIGVALQHVGSTLDDLSETLEHLTREGDK